MPKTYKNGTREVRAYEILRPHVSKGWKRLEAKKVSPTVAYGVYTKVQELGGIVTRVYRGVVAEWQGEGKESKSTSMVRGSLVDVEDWITSQKRFYRHIEEKKKIDRFLNAIILPEK